MCRRARRAPGIHRRRAIAPDRSAFTGARNVVTSYGAKLGEAKSCGIRGPSSPSPAVESAIRGTDGAAEARSELNVMTGGIPSTRVGMGRRSSLRVRPSWPNSLRPQQ